MISMQQWRERILQRTLLASTVLASIAYFPSLIASYLAGMWSLIVVSTAVWISLIIITCWRSLAPRIRSTAFIVIWSVFAVYLLWLLGPLGAGTLWLLSIPVLGALYFGYPGAYAGSGLLIALMFIYPWLPLPAVAATNPTLSLRYPLDAWFAVSGSMVFLAGLMSLAIAELLKGLENTITAITEANHELERSLKERESLQEELLLNRNQTALGTLATAIAHDFNNLLVPIMMAGEAAREQAPEGSEQRRHLDAVVRSAERARSLIRRILLFSQTEGMEPKKVALAPVMEAAVNKLRSSADPRFTIVYDNTVPDACVSGESNAIQQIVMNLGSNALMALPASGGRLTITVTRDPDDPAIHVSVSDNGPGIPDSIRDRIFDPYFSTRSPGTGTGLGLTIVQRLVTALSGRIQLASAEGSGTTFTVSLPEHSDAPAPVALQHPPSADSENSQPEEQLPALLTVLRILVVDDEEMVRSTLQATLQRDRHEVMTCNSADAALAYLQANPDSVDVVITDFAMPGMSGLDLVRQLRSRGSQLPCILLSGYLTGDDVKSSRELGVLGVLYKPFRRQAIISMLARVPPASREAAARPEPPSRQ